MEQLWIITKWCKIITDDGRDWYVNKEVNKKDMQLKFRLLDDDGIIYGYGVSKEITFAPLTQYRESYGVTKIEYKNKETGKYEVL